MREAEELEQPSDGSYWMFAREDAREGGVEGAWALKVGAEESAIALVKKNQVDDKQGRSQDP